MPVLHFSQAEYDRRLRAVLHSMGDAGLDGLVLFRQESMYYLTGYDTSGYTMFQGMYLGADGKMALLTRSADRIQSRMTSIIPDIRIWIDRDSAEPADELKELLRDYGCEKKRVGVEYHAYGLTGQRARMVDAALDGFCETVDASDLVRLVRMIKSDSELECVRKAGELCDQMLEVSIEKTRPGNRVKSVYGSMMQVLMSHCLNSMEIGLHQRLLHTLSSGMVTSMASLMSLPIPLFASVSSMRMASSFQNMNNARCPFLLISTQWSSLRYTL